MLAKHIDASFASIILCAATKLFLALLILLYVTNRRAKLSTIYHSNKEF